MTTEIGSNSTEAFHALQQSVLTLSFKKARYEGVNTKALAELETARLEIEAEYEAAIADFQTRCRVACAEITSELSTYVRAILEGLKGKFSTEFNTWNPLAGKYPRENIEELGRKFLGTMRQFNDDALDLARNDFGKRLFALIREYERQIDPARDIRKEKLDRVAQIYSASVRESYRDYLEAFKAARELRRELDKTLNTVGAPVTNGSIDLPDPSGVRLNIQRS